ncbi:MAG: hypothetical protein KGO96_12240 [Elusimicrobia bacterium]|nr:hypothetical protein [Elusimicrobiota bacterium]
MTSQTRATSQAQEEQRLAQMLPEERAEYIARQTAQRQEQQFAELRREMQDSADRAAFAAACASDPRLSRVQSEVEAQLTALRSQGTTLPRTELAAYILGKKLLEKSATAGKRQRSEAAGRVARETARPVNGGGSTPTPNSSRAARDDRAARLARLSADDAFI